MTIQNKLYNNRNFTQYKAIFQLHSTIIIKHNQKSRTVTEAISDRKKQ